MHRAQAIPRTLRSEDDEEDDDEFFGVKSKAPCDTSDGVGEDLFIILSGLGGGELELASDFE